MASNSKTDSSTAADEDPSEELRLLRTEEKMKQINERLEGLEQKQVADSEQQKIDQKALSATIDQGMNQIKEHIAKIELNLNIVALHVAKIGLTTRNRWDVAACHRDLTISGPDRLIVQHVGEYNGCRSVFAVEPIRRLDFGIFYYEVTILEKQDLVCIGLAPKQTFLLEGPFRDHEGTYAYEGNGIFWGHSFAGCKRNTKGRPFVSRKPQFDKNDVVGCGINLATRQIIYTKNGRPLATDALVVSTEELFPCVSMSQVGVKIEADFRKFRL